MRLWKWLFVTRSWGISSNTCHGFNCHRQGTCPWRVMAAALTWGGGAGARSAWPSLWQGGRQGGWLGGWLGGCMAVGLCIGMLGCPNPEQSTPSSSTRRQTLPSVSPADGANLVFTLDGVWRCKSPRCVIAPNHAARSFEIERTLRLPDAWASRPSATLTIDALGWRIGARVNGLDVGSDQGGPWSATLDLSGHLKAGTNLLELRFDPSPWCGGTSRSAPAPITRRQPLLGDGFIWLNAHTQLDLASDIRIEYVSVFLEKDRLTASARVSNALKVPVSMKVVRDGILMARFPLVGVNYDREAVASVPWNGERWEIAGRGAAELHYLVIEVEGGARRQLRFGVRELERKGDRLMLNGRPIYLAADHLERALGRDGMSEMARKAFRLGANALEIPAQWLTPDGLEALDELGLMMVQRIGCAEPGGGIAHDTQTHDWTSWERFSGHELAEYRRSSPSLTVLYLNAVGLLERFASDRGAVGVPVVSGAEARGINLNRERDWTCGGCTPPFISAVTGLVGEAAGSADASLIQTRLTPLLSAHSARGLGLVLPQLNLKREASAAQVAAIHGVLKNSGVTAFGMGRNRSTSLIRVVGVKDGHPAEGEAMALLVRGQPPMGFFLDGQGKALVDVYYSGEAEVRWLDGQVAQSVTMVPGEFLEGKWHPAVAAVSLILDESE